MAQAAQRRGGVDGPGMLQVDDHGVRAESLVELLYQLSLIHI